LPLAVSAQTAASHYTTAIIQVYGSQYPLTGRLDLQIFPNGTVRGYYHTSYYKLYVPVAGGRDGDYIWFDIGPSTVDLGLGAGPEGKLHVVATMSKDGSFRGQVYPETTADLSGLANQYEVTSPLPQDFGTAGAAGDVAGGGRKHAAAAAAVSPPPPGTSVTTVSQAADQFIFTATPSSSAEPAPSP
jgi:hypothetical protein